MKREFFYQDDRSNKFWTIELVGTGYVTTHGRVGSTGRETRKQFDSEDKARRECEKQITAKLKKGYTEGAPPAYQPPDWTSMSMSEDVFWRIIGLFNWKKLGDDDAVIGPAVRALSQMSEDDIRQFEEILAEKLYALDTLAHASEIGEDSYQPGKYFSVDEFLYTRACVVANGPKFYEQVLANPTAMPEDAEFEALLSVGRMAWERRTGDDEFDHATDVCYETYSNRAGWADAEES